MQISVVMCRLSIVAFTVALIWRLCADIRCYVCADIGCYVQIVCYRSTLIVVHLFSKLIGVHLFSCSPYLLLFIMDEYSSGCLSNFSQGCTFLLCLHCACSSRKISVDFYYLRCFLLSFLGSWKMIRK